MERPSPPRFLLRFFRWFCRKELHVYIEGDLLELYEERLQTKGKHSADLRFAADVLLLFRPSIIKPLSNIRLKNNNDMLINYLKIAFRNLLRKRVYAGINITGLAIGMACCMLIFQFVLFEFSVDRFHENASSIYRINQVNIEANNDRYTQGNTGWAPGPVMAAQVPEVVDFLRLHPEYDNAIITNPEAPEKTFEETRLFYADSTFFSFFSFPLVRGNADAMLRYGTVAISESMAAKYFGDADPIGQTLDIRGWISGLYRVTGIFSDVPANSHLQFDFLVPMSDLLTKSEFKNPDTGWGWSNFLTYVQLDPAADAAIAAGKISSIYQENRAETFRRRNRQGAMSLQTLTAIHLDNSIHAPFTIVANRNSVYFFGIVGIITLLIAFINYVNITTARALDRAREVGVRKVVGARKHQLITQFLTESALTIFIAFLLACLLSYILSPWISNLTGIRLDGLQWSDPTFWIGFTAVLLLLTLVAGMYPALLLSSFTPKSVLKGKNRQAGISGYLRHGLVAFQFTISIALLAGTLIVQNQLHFMRLMDLGMELDQIVTIQGPRVLPEDMSDPNAFELLSMEIQRLPSVMQTATSHSLPGKGHSFSTNNIRRGDADETEELEGSITFVDSAFTSLFGFEIIAGNGFTNITLPLPEDAEKRVLANETAIRRLGFNTPEEAVNQRIEIGGNDCLITGVLRDFHWSSAHEDYQPIFLLLGQFHPQLSARIPAASIPETLVAMEERFRELFPGNPFVYSFADETFASQYRNDQRFSKLFNVFAGLAIFIACLGLFGLATHTARQRQKEVGIRKVLGANISNIVMLLSRDFMKLVGIGFIAAVPLAWYVMRGWLVDFAFRADINISVFFLAGGAAAAIALLTVSWQSINAALINPSESLRDE